MQQIYQNTPAASKSVIVWTVHEKNGSDPVPDFTSTILADPEPDPIY